MSIRNLTAGLHIAFASDVGGGGVAPPSSADTKAATAGSEEAAKLQPIAVYYQKLRLPEHLMSRETFIRNSLMLSLQKTKRYIAVASHDVEQQIDQAVQRWKSKSVYSSSIPPDDGFGRGAKLAIGGEIVGDPVSCDAEIHLVDVAEGLSLGIYAERLEPCSEEKVLAQVSAMASDLIPREPPVSRASKPSTGIYIGMLFDEPPSRLSPLDREVLFKASMDGNDRYLNDSEFAQTAVSAQTQLSLEGKSEEIEEKIRTYLRRRQIFHLGGKTWEYKDPFDNSYCTDAGSVIEKVPDSNFYSAAMEVIKACPDTQKDIFTGTPQSAIILATIHLRGSSLRKDAARFLAYVKVSATIQIEKLIKIVDGLTPMLYTSQETDGMSRYYAARALSKYLPLLAEADGQGPESTQSLGKALTSLALSANPQYESSGSNRGWALRAIYEAGISTFFWKSEVFEAIRKPEVLKAILVSLDPALENDANNRAIAALAASTVRLKDTMCPLIIGALTKLLNPAVEGSPRVRQEVIATFKSMYATNSSRVADAVIKSLDPISETNDDVRCAAASALTGVSSKPVRDRAIQALTRSLDPAYERSESVRIAAIGSLGRMGKHAAGQKTVQALRKLMLFDDEAASAASEALQSILPAQ